MPRPGTKQVIRTTVRGPAQVTRERRDAYREQLQGYMKSRTDLKAGAPQAAPSPAPVPAYKAPSQAGGMGGKSAAKRAQRNAHARAHRATLRQRKLGSPLSAKAAPPAQAPAAPSPRAAPVTQPLQPKPSPLQGVTGSTYSGMTWQQALQNLRQGGNTAGGGTP